MSLNARALAILARLGATAADILEMAEAIDGSDILTARRTADRERKARQRAREEELSRDMSRDGHVTSPPKDKSNPLSFSSPPLAPKKTHGKNARATRRCPSAWSPTDADIGVGEALGYTAEMIERQLAMLRDYEFATPRVDWSATFRNWLRKNPPNAKCFQQPSAKLLAFETNMANAFAGAQMAAHGRQARE